MYTKEEYYLVGYDNAGWGGFDTLEKARKEAEIVKKGHPDKTIKIERYIVLTEIVEEQ